MVYARTYYDESVLVVVFTGDYDTEIHIPAWLGGFTPDKKIRRVMYTYDDGYNVGSMAYTMEDKYLHMKIIKNSGIIFVSN